MPVAVNQYSLTSCNVQGGRMLEKIHFWTVRLLLCRSWRRKIHKSRKNAESRKHRVCEFGTSLWLQLPHSCKHAGEMSFPGRSTDIQKFARISCFALFCRQLEGTTLSCTAPRLFTITCVILVNQFSHKSTTLMTSLGEEVACCCCFNENLYWWQVFW